MAGRSDMGRTRRSGFLSQPGPDGWPNRYYAWYVVITLNIVALFSYIDRFIIGILIEPIRSDLQISDVQVSLIAGTGFALFYGCMALPLGRLADRKSRVMIVSVSIFSWSLLTSLSALSNNFWQFFVARMGVGIAEASLASSAYSLIADYFPPKRLPVAMSVYMASVMLGSSAALLVGGWIFAHAVVLGPVTLPVVGLLQPWQMTLIVVGLPGILISVLMSTIREPIRRGRLGAEDEPMTIRQVLRFMRGMSSFLAPHHIGFSLLALYTYAIFIWSPTFLTRTFGLSIAEAGSIFGGIVLVAGMSGVYAGGLIGQTLRNRGVADAVLRVSVYALAMLVPAAVAMPLMPSVPATVVMLGLTIFIFSVAMAGAAVALQMATPNEMRGQVMAFFSLASVVIGLGGGPSAVALLTDRWFHDPNAIRYSLSIVGGAAALISCVLVGLSLRPFRARLSTMAALRDADG